MPARTVPHQVMPQPSLVRMDPKKLRLVRSSKHKPRKPKDEKKSKKRLRRGIIILCGCVLGLSAVGAAVAVPLTLMNSGSTESSLTPIATRATTTALSPQSCTAGSPTMLLNLLNPGLFSYIYYSYSYTPTTYQATIMVELQQDPSTIYINAISITNTTGGELLTNGGFETGGLPPWQRGTVSGGSISSGCGYSGTYCYADGIVGQTDNIHQTFLTVPGSNITVSFYLQNNAAGSTIIARVCIYPY